MEEQANKMLVEINEWIEYHQNKLSEYKEQRRMMKDYMQMKQLSKNNNPLNKLPGFIGTEKGGNNGDVK